MGNKKKITGIITPISTEDLRRSVRDMAAPVGERDGIAATALRKLIQAELDYIKNKRPEAHENDLAGLALSGGGIRSATFALGVMQALARESVLKRLDYMSTVSGGSYIGSAVSWFLGPLNSQNESGKNRFGLDKDNFPFGVDSGWGGTELQATILNWLRQNGKYLTPGGGITLMSGLTIVLRSIFLNLVVWMPICAALFWLLLRATERLTDWIAGWVGSPWMPEFAGQAYALLITLSSRPSFVPTNKFEIWESENSIVMVGLCVTAVVATLFFFNSLVYSFIPSTAVKNQTNKRYNMRRLFEIYTPRYLWLAVAILVIVSLPYVDAAITQWINNAGGLLAALIGSGAGLRNYLQVRKTKEQITRKFIRAVEAGLIVYGVGLISFQLALYLPIEFSDIPAWYWGILTLAVVAGGTVNINSISIHQFYRDRLMEAYLPEMDRIMSGRSGPSISANSAALQSLQDNDSAHGPYHLINTNVVLVNSHDKRRRLRGGDSFILSAIHSGSNATGWVNTAALLGGRLTLATATAISGAAANPHAGSGGGVTKSPSISLLMTLLNIRLGYWIPNLTRGGFSWPPNHFFPGLMQAFGKHHEKAAFIELSDGGHFENLGLYELVRRKLRLIIVCDAGADPTFSFSDLNTVRRRIGADFGAYIHFEEGHDPKQLIPARLKESSPGHAGYAVDADMAKTGHLLGRIQYADGTTGALVYIKTTMVDTVSFGVKAYKGTFPDFPDESTVDQFFDVAQFDAYRELGQHLGTRMLEDTKLHENLAEVIAKGRW